VFNLLRPYLEYIKKTFQNNAVYRINTLFGILNTVFSIFVYTAIWKVLYSFNDTINGINFKMTATNFVITLGLSNIFLFDDNMISGKVQNGSIAQDLLKPVSFNGFIFAQTAGNVCFKLVAEFLPALLISIIFIGIQLPSSLLSACFFLISLVLGFLVFYFINYIVSITAFWFQNIFALQQIKNALILILSGVLLPLWFMPEILIKIINLSPFGTIYFIPITIYLGQLTGNELLFSLIKQCLWIIFLAGAGRLLWNRAIKKLVIQGG
jgi:ABC-2 type transport system permease protein